MPAVAIRIAGPEAFRPSSDSVLRWLKNRLAKKNEIFIQGKAHEFLVAFNSDGQLIHSARRKRLSDGKRNAAFRVTISSKT